MHLEGETLSRIIRIYGLLCAVRTNAAALHTDYPSSQSNPILEIDTDTAQIRKELAALIQLYDQRDPQQALEQALLAADDLLQSIDDVFEVYKSYSCRSILWPVNFWRCERRKSSAYSNVSDNARRLQRKVHSAFNAIAEYVQGLMPIPLSEITAGQICYEQVRQSPQAAIQLVFALLEDYLREKIGVGPDVYGEDLINQAFGRGGCLVYGQVPAEQTGLRNFLSGAYATLRNPRMHRILADDELMALTVVALADLLIQIINEADRR